MIRIVRGAEPTTLAEQRTKGLAKLRITRAAGALSSDDFPDTYREVAQDLWEMQHLKCCYCEFKIKELYNDVEHFRPKTRADRRPGRAADEEGYWWLAWSWENLLFACPSCNRTGKNDRFPLASSAVLSAEDAPPGSELPLLLDPCGTINPMTLIRFQWTSLAEPPGERHWYATSEDWRGVLSIQCFGLNHQDLLELRADYAMRTLCRRWQRLQEALKSGVLERVNNEVEEAMHLFHADQPFAAFAYDAITEHVPSSILASAGARPWPRREELPLPPIAGLL